MIPAAPPVRLQARKAGSQQRLGATYPQLTSAFIGNSGSCRGQKSWAESKFHLKQATRPALKHGSCERAFVARNFSIPWGQSAASDYRRLGPRHPGHRREMDRPPHSDRLTGRLSSGNPCDKGFDFPGKVGTHVANRCVNIRARFYTGQRVSRWAAPQADFPSRERQPPAVAWGQSQV